MRSVAIVLVFLAASGCLGAGTPQTPNADNASPAQNPDLTYYSSPLFLVYYPRGWHTDQPQNGVLVISSPPDEKTNATSQFIVEIWAGNESTPQEFKSYEMGLAQPGDSVTSESSTKFKGRDAYEIELESHPASGEPAFTYKTIFFRNNGWVYRLSYSLDKNRAAELRPVMESILDKFVIGSY